jgi:predicted Zn-dependent peptidase
MSDRAPETRVAHLDGGMPLLLDLRAGRSSAGTALSLGLGSRDDPSGLGGAAMLLGRLIISVPLQRGPSLIERVGQLGGTCGVVTGAESLTVHARVPADGAPEAAAWMLDALTQPALSHQALDRERRIAAAQPPAVAVDPADALRSVFLRAVFPGHPLGKALDGTQGGTPGGAEAVTLDALLEAHQQALTRAPLALAYVGDVRETELRARISPLAMARAGGVRPGRSPDAPAGRPGTPDPDWPDGPCLLLAGAPAPSAVDPARDAFVLLGHVLGARAESRGHRHLHEEGGRRYAFRPWARAYSDAGVWGLLARTDGADGPAVVRALRAELARLARHGPTPGALDAAVTEARTKLLRKAENEVDSAIAAATHYCLSGAVRSPEAEAARLAGVSAADVARAAAAVAEGLLVVAGPNEPPSDTRGRPAP